MKLIEFHAMWCPSCLVMGKTYQKLKDIYSDFSFDSYDYDIDQEMVQKYHIDTKLPVLIIEKESGEEVQRIVGEHKLKELQQMIEEYLK